MHHDPIGLVVAWTLLALLVGLPLTLAALQALEHVANWLRAPRKGTHAWKREPRANFNRDTVIITGVIVIICLSIILKGAN